MLISPEWGGGYSGKRVVVYVWRLRVVIFSFHSLFKGRKKTKKCKKFKGYLTKDRKFETF